MESTTKFKSGGKLSQKFADAFDKRMNNIEYMDDERLLALWKDCIETEQYTGNNALKSLEESLGYSKEQIYEEILTRMNN